MRFKEMFREIPEIFLAFLLVTVILRELGFSLESEAISTFIIILNTTLSLLAVISYYLNSSLTRNNTKVLLTISLLSLFLLGEPLLLAGVLLTVLYPSLLLSTSKVSKALKIGTIIFNTFVVAIGTIVIIVSLLFSNFFGGFVKREEISKVPSPNGLYNLVVTNIDQGALGGNTAVYVERSFYGLAKWNRLVFIGHWQQIPILSWSGNNNVDIDGVIQNVYFVRKVDKR